jgi:chromate transporter
MKVSPLAIGLTFLKLTTTNYGGAQSAATRREVVGNKHWLTDTEWLDLRSIAMVAPGPNSPNVAILIGQKLAGTPGAIVAFLAASVPGAAIALLLGVFSLDPHAAWTAGVLRGCAAAATGASVANALEMTLFYRSRWFSFAIVIVAAVAVIYLHFSLWLTLLVFVPITILGQRRQAGTA